MEKKDKNETKDFDKFTNTLISKVSNNLENFSYNVLVANLHETYNYLIKNLDLIFDNKIILENYMKILTLFCPLIPHVINECIEDLKINKKITWPDVNKNFVNIENINIVIQINGKKRDLLNLKKSVTEKEIIKMLVNSEKTSKYLEKKEIKKTIYIKDKLINIIV